jgi:Tfp pilus assembly protein PilF
VIISSRSIRTATLGVAVVVLVGCASALSSPKESRDRGMKLYQQQNYVDAAGAFRNAVQQNPRDFKSFYYMGACYDAMKMDHQAIQSYQSGLDVMKVTLAGREDQAMRVMMIDALARSIARGNDRTFQTALEARTQTAETKYLQAKIHQNLGDADSALESYQQAILLDKNDFAIIKDYGLYLEQLGQAENATRILRRAYAMNTKDEQVVAALRRIGVVPGPSLKEQEQLVKPPVPKGPLPQIDVAKMRNNGKPAGGTASTDAGTSGPRD